MGGVDRYIPEEKVIIISESMRSRGSIGGSGDAAPPVRKDPTIREILQTPEAVFIILHLMFIIELIVCAQSR